MNITCSPVNSPREIALRIAYLIPMPLMLAACFLPLWALVRHDWAFLALGLLCVPVALTIRRFGVRHWQFLRLDDAFDRLPDAVSGFVMREETAIDELLEETTRWSERNHSQAEWLDHFSQAGFSRYGEPHDPWLN